MNVKCRKCKQLGHYQSHFPADESDKEEEEGVKHFHAQDLVFLLDYDGDDDVGLHQRLCLMGASKIYNDFTNNCILLDTG